jgi:glycosyltransferase involved in cell wall biosynthesis
MRILLLAHYGLPHVGGIEIVLDDLAGYFEDRGHQVVIVVSSAHGEGSPPSAGRIVRVPASNLAEDRLGLPWPIFSPSLIPVLKREVARADVVHAHGVLYMTSLLGLRLARRSPGRPGRVITEHVGHVPYASRVLDGLESVALHTLGKLTARAAQEIIVLNDDVGAFMAELAPRRSVRRLDNGLDLDEYRPAEPGEYDALRAERGWDARPVVLFVGRRVAKKGIDAVLGAAATARDLRFVLVGAGERQAGSPPNVEYLGTVTRDELRLLYRAADAFLLPSYGEGFSLAAQEAMASAVPILLRAGQGHGQLALEAAPGVIESEAEGEALADALRSLFGDPDRHAAARASVRRVAERRFCRNTWAEQHLQLYESVLAGEPSGDRVLAR